jgi:hypothetical protein
MTQWLLSIAAYLTIGAAFGELCLRGQKMLGHKTNYLSWTFVVLLWPAYVTVIFIRAINRRRK